jgi:hypothetical protein
MHKFPLTLILRIMWSVLILHSSFFIPYLLISAGWCRCQMFEILSVEKQNYEPKSWWQFVVKLLQSPTHTHTHKKTIALLFYKLVSVLYPHPQSSIHSRDKNAEEKDSYFRNWDISFWYWSPVLVSVFKMAFITVALMKVVPELCCCVIHVMIVTFIIFIDEFCL